MENGYLKHWKCLERGFWNHNSTPVPLEQFPKKIKKRKEESDQSNQQHERTGSESEQK